MDMSKMLGQVRTFFVLFFILFCFVSFCLDVCVAWSVVELPKASKQQMSVCTRPLSPARAPLLFFLLGFLCFLFKYRFLFFFFFFFFICLEVVLGICQHRLLDETTDRSTTQPNDPLTDRPTDLSVYLRTE